MTDLDLVLNGYEVVGPGMWVSSDSPFTNPIDVTFNSEVLITKMILSIYPSDIPWQNFSLLSTADIIITFDVPASELGSVLPYSQGFPTWRGNIIRIGRGDGIEANSSTPPNTAVVARDTHYVNIDPNVICGKMSFLPNPSVSSSSRFNISYKYYDVMRKR